MGSENFQVDLHGIVDLLSNHLYSSPRVYLRELLQNAVDAITARQAAEPQAPARIDVRTGPDRLSITDTGIGLRPDEVRELLATIGRSSKRDEIGFARTEFLGQFGIGLLSAFMVADEIEVLTHPTAGPTTRWVGTADGRYTISEADPAEETGTTVTLKARRGAEQWFKQATVIELIKLFGALLPLEIRVDGERVTEGKAPWENTGATQRAELVGYAQDKLGFTPFDVIPLNNPAAGLTGVAFVLPFPANPAERATHRVYLKRMLLAEGVEGLLPDWAFFVRAVIDTSELRPTASREALFDDGNLEETREALGAQLRGWLVRLGSTDPQKLDRFLAIHQLGVKALALHDDELLRLVHRWLKFETNHGRMTSAELHERYGEIRYAATIEEFRQLAAVAAAQQLTVVNGGYTYDSELLERLPDVVPGLAVSRFDPTELSTSFDSLDPETELALRPFVRLAQEALDAVGCEVVVRAFDPAGLPAIYLVDRSAQFAAELRSTKSKADALWSEVLGALDTHDDSRPQLVLNHRSPLVRRMAGLADPELARLAVEGLYGHALMLGYHPIGPADSALVNRSFLGLLDQAVPTQEDPK
ncbi:molecular chaperone HtpG [Kribbella voronezhensis]|uniref:Molecular chaperone HtpG n=1 Tax=Kribbella voronezhensis TaxID=2512212 RepID=A0A4R7THA8_9ACTN|nr:HSP90 family protein [Kribbella voronezhensis]TDU91016.1 molecular chaperone HtpG [Kribbella voronezhensis]